jgi:hypothetical protein
MALIPVCGSSTVKPSLMFVVLTLVVRCATMRLVGSAALWYQTMQTAISTMSWETFVTTLCNRFDKDEHNHLIRHFFHIKQTTCVTEYVEQFSDLVHQILAHDPTFPQTIITNHFLDGLKKILELLSWFIGL